MYYPAVSCFSSFFIPAFYGAARSELAFSEVYDADRLAPSGIMQKRARRREFDVVGVGTKCKYI